MALKIWLPLNGNLKNIGTNRSAQVTNTNAVVNNNGKIGKCYSFGTGASGLALPASAMQNFSEECSLSLWVNILSWNTAYATLFQAGPNAYAWKDYIFGVLRNNNGSNLCFSISDGTTGSAANYTTSVLDLNKWYNLIFTYKTGECKIYINGELDKKYSPTIVPNFSAITNISIGRSNKTSYQSNCLMNDVRIYDHCLSVLEVKEISQGLILHYKLNGFNGGAGENLLPNTSFNGISQKYILNSGTEGGFMYAPISVNKSTSYTISCYLRGNANMTLYRICSGGNEATPWINRNDMSETEYKYFSITFTSPAEKDISQIYICTRYGTSNSQVGDWFEIKPYSLKMEQGSIATAWTPTLDEMGKDLTRVVDSSGYGNDGELYFYDSLGSITNVPDTPKYSSSIYINSENNTTNTASGTCYIYGHCGLTNPTAMSVAFWCKPVAGYTGVTTQGQFCTTNYEYGNSNVGVDYQASAMNHRDGTININDSASTTQCNVPINFTANEWHHYAVTYDGQTGRTYKDGVLTNTVAFSAAKTLDSFIGVIIGFSRAGGVWRSNKSYYSDFRVYATTLSAADILSLYNTPANIDKLGRVHGFEFAEKETTNLSDFSPSTDWVTDGEITRTVEVTDFGPALKLTTSAANKRIYKNVSNVWNANQAYTVSFYAKASVNGITCNMSRSLADFSENFTLTTGWKKYTGTIKCTSTNSGGTLSFRIVPASGIVYIKNIKLELANPNLIKINKNGIFDENNIDELDFANVAKFMKNSNNIIGFEFIEK